MRPIGCNADPVTATTSLPFHADGHFAGKPASVSPAIRDLCVDCNLAYYILANAMEPIVAAAGRIGADALADGLAQAVGIAADESADWEVRFSCGNLLIEFPRDGHQALVDGLAKRDVGFARSFDVEDIERAYGAGKDVPCWMRFDNSWMFYEPQAIVERQERWVEEAARDCDDELLDDEVAIAGRARNLRARDAQDRAQRSLSVREREEVQEMLVAYPEDSQLTKSLSRLHG